MNQGIKKPSPSLGRGSERLAVPPNLDHSSQSISFGPLTGSGVPHTVQPIDVAVLVQARGGFSTAEPRGDSQQFVSVFCWDQVRLLVPVRALFYSEDR